MPSWFSNVFSKPRSAPAAQRFSRAELAAVLTEDDDVEPEALEAPPPRRVVDAPVITPDAPSRGLTDGIRIKAQPLHANACVFLVDRPVFAGRSIVCSGPENGADAPLAQRLFALGEEVIEVVIHHLTVKVRTHPRVQTDWETFAPRVGAAIREHLESGGPAVSPEFEAAIPSEEALRAEIDDILESVVNPGIAAHSGRIRLDRVEGNTVYLEMLGGCQGCAASQITLKQGVERLLRDAMPQLGAVLDVTDHAAGNNPYYRELPA